MVTKRHRRFAHGRRMAALTAGLALAGCSLGDDQEPVFCYRTLADVSCYLEPDRDRAGRLVGVYLRDADSPSDKDYWLRETEARMSR
jgi:hypothetical protein